MDDFGIGFLLDIVLSFIIAINWGHSLGEDIVLQHCEEDGYHQKDQERYLCRKDVNVNTK